MRKPTTPYYMRDLLCNPLPLSLLLKPSLPSAPPNVTILKSAIMNSNRIKHKTLHQIWRYLVNLSNWIELNWIVVDDSSEGFNFANSTLQLSVWSLIRLIVRTIFVHCRWRVFSKEECPVRCGKGMRRQLVHCIKQTGFSQAEIVKDHHCRKTLGAKPDEHVPCSGKCLPTYWSYTKWSQVLIFLLLIYYFRWRVIIFLSWDYRKNWYNSFFYLHRIETLKF